MFHPGGLRRRRGVAAGGARDEDTDDGDTDEDAGVNEAIYYKKNLPASKGICTNQSCTVLLIEYRRLFACACL